VTETDATVRPRAVHLLEYLTAVRAIKEPPVRDVAEYRDKRWWAADIPEHPSCVVTATGEGPWLRVAKASVPAVPLAPTDIEPCLVTGAADPRREPAFSPDFAERFIARHVAPVVAKVRAERSRLGDEEGTDEHDGAGDEEAPEIARARAEAEREAARLLALLRDYVNGSWRAWAGQALIALDARALYDHLFELRQRLQRDSAFIELVWGHGILSWVAPDGSRVQHPLVTTQAQLEFDAGTGTISVEPDVLLPHHLDIDLLQGLRLDGFGLLLDVREGFRQSPVGPFDPEARDLYGRLLAPLGQDGQVRDATRPPTPQAAPVITASWILMVRRRSTMYQRFFTEMREALESGKADVAAPIVSVIASEPSKLDQAALASGEDWSWQRAAERLLMPLPTNPEQEQVARRLAEHRGVTVQGPPGTGKTHTIANLISHLVGHGKRVLVTSQKEQALAVLRDKIPDSVRDLSVAVLGSSTTSLGQLRQSVQAINENAVSLDRPTARQRISRLDTALTQAQRDVAALRTRISQVSEREREAYTVGAATYTPSTLGHWLAASEAELSFIPDVIQPGTACPLTAAELADLFQLARAITPADRDKARCLLPVVGNLPAPAELMGIRSELLEIRDRLAETESAVQDRVALERLSPEELAVLTEAVDQASKRLEQLEQPWLATLRGQLRNPAFAGMWRDQLEHLQAAIGDLAVLRNQTLGHQIALPDSVPPKELQQLLGQLRDRLAAGKGVSKLLQKDLHRVRESCLVDEEPLRTAADVDLAIAELRARSHRGQMVRRWNDAIGTVGGPVLTIGIAYPEYELAGHVDGLSGAFGWEGGDWQALSARLSAAGVRVSLVPSSGELAALAGTLRIAALHIREKELNGRLNSLVRHLTDGAAQPTASELWALLRDALVASDWQRWELAVDETRRLASLTGYVARFDQLAARLGAVAAIWAGKIRVSSGTETDIGTAEKALGAWEWRQGETWLQGVLSAGDPAALQGQLEGKLTTVATLTADLAAESAWLGLAERLTDAERRALTAWTDAVRRIGKGTGKYAPHWRSIAQQAMREAQGAVPVWIMPMHRVVESFGADSARFDVVIVDESSQCDLFSLAALAIADKAVIVGDDQQISPQMVGTEESVVHELIDQYIADIPQAALLDIKTSLYDMAKMRFPGVITLREHFRCLPEIIEFSNQLCYGGDILPLREQPTDPTWRSVIDVQVPDGFREKGTDTNQAEADFVVGKIAELCGDPQYDGKTFGVISLLGDGQAQLIESMLIERLGEREMESRQVRCGNAYHFQGDERDVIFVSLVAAVGEGRRIGAMTREPDRQRINVAASRARDQLWCVRSISLDDLHPDDVRGLLIRHCQAPTRITEAEATASFDSDFERDVYRKIIARGYRVRTQYKVGRYRIDMVIEGAGGRLALELDGDAFHGPDRWDADRQRQAILERLGWTFHRIRGSAYYRLPEESLSSLWERLDSLDIYPAGDARS
jgi:very-short-patch-repair endonuclease